MSFKNYFTILYCLFLSVKIKEVIKILENDGWYYVHTKGSHRKFKYPFKKGAVTVAGKPSSDIHPEILKSIYKQAQLLKNKN